jgi:hypothetical protein
MTEAFLTQALPFHSLKEQRQYSLWNSLEISLPEYLFLCPYWGQLSELIPLIHLMFLMRFKRRTGNSNIPELSEVSSRGSKGSKERVMIELQLY